MDLKKLIIDLLSNSVGPAAIICLVGYFLRHKISNFFQKDMIQTQNKFNMGKDITSHYASPWLIHWTSRTGGDQVGLENLNAILSDQLLKLSENRIIKIYFDTGVKAKMVCFTDVPLRFSARHCCRYGRFGIAFNKRKLILKGAQPVFYVTPVCRENVKNILKFIYDPPQNCNIPESIKISLDKHFYFMQEFSEGSIDAQDAYYYEREWRLGEQSLPSEELLAQPNAKLRIKNAGYSAYYGKKVVKDNVSYFAFEDEDVAFIIYPEEYASDLKNPKDYKHQFYKEIVGNGTTF